jgi:hypothetical protein
MYSYRIFTMYWTALQCYAHIRILRRRYIGSRPPKNPKLFEKFPLSIGLVRTLGTLWPSSPRFFG